VVRKDVWEIIEDKMLKPRDHGLNLFVITGMGGCGKTQMTAYFVQRYQSKYVPTRSQVYITDFNPSSFKHIFFIDASSHSTIKSDLRSTIRSIDGHQQDTEEDALTFLADNPDSLLIFDNADDPTLELVPFFPKTYRGIILITSRVRSLGELATLHHLELGPMSAEEAIHTLSKAARRTLPLPAQDDKYANELIEELGCLALALVQAGVYIFNMGSVQVEDVRSSPFEHYLSLFRRERGSLMRREGTTSLDQYKRGVYPTLDLSYSLLPPITREFLGLCSQFHYTNISLSMILASTKRDFEDEKSYVERPKSHTQVKERLRALFRPRGVLDESHVREIIQSLVSLSLVQVTVAKDTILLRFHPLVHAWATEKSSQGDESLYLQMAVIMTSTCMKSIPPSHLQYFPPHILSFMSKKCLSNLNITDLTIFGEFMGDNGMAKASLELLEEAAKQLEQGASPVRPGTSEVYVFLAGAYVQSGKLNEAEALLLKALGDERRLSTEEGLEIMKINQALAGLYYYMGKYKECEDLLLRVEKVFLRELGDKHEDTLGIWSMLGATYLELGKRKEAQEIRTRVYDIERKSLGERHPDTITSANGLAAVYLLVGRLAEAVELLDKNLEMLRDIRGEKHLDTVAAYNNLARAYQELGKWNEAEELQLKAISILDGLAGWEDPDILTMASNLISIYIDLEKLNEAEELVNKVLTIRRKVLGGEHPDTISSQNALALVYSKIGRLMEAEEMLVKGVTLLEESLGQRHPTTLAGSTMLGTVYRKLAKLKEAEELQVRTYKIVQEEFGELHRFSIRASANLAATYHKQGRDKEAEELGRRTVELGKTVFGESNLAYISILKKLSGINLEPQPGSS
jgi:tetratricopeptide (TPR) repeat protein